MTISLITIFVLLLIWELISAVTEKHPDVMGLVSAEVTRGMVIDAGSGGSRLHVYRWKPRVFNTTPPPISYPEADEKWTKRTNPGIHELLGDNDAIAVHLSGLIEAAKKFLKGCESEFHLYPVYFKATGGVRELALEDRESILLTVKKLLSDKSFSPFYFQDDFARVISGNFL